MINPYAAPSAQIDDIDNGTYEPGFFSFEGRLGRIRYLAFSFGGQMLIGIIFGLLAAALAAIAPPLALLGSVLSTVASFVVFFVMTKRRLNDLDQSGWFGLLWLVPVVNLLFFLYLIFAPGSAGSNRFGQRSSPNSVILIIGALIAPLVIVGILAAVAIPAYQSYVAKARAVNQSHQAPQMTPQ